jgi:putative transcriptional regulator
MPEKELRKRDSARDLGAELLESVREMKENRVGHVHRVECSRIASARTKTMLSQRQFAALLGVSLRTLQDWEQGRRQPSGAARTLIAIAEAHPEVLHELASGSS